MHYDTFVGHHQNEYQVVGNYTNKECDEANQVAGAQIETWTTALQTFVRQGGRCFHNLLQAVAVDADTT